MFFRSVQLVAYQLQIVFGIKNTQRKSVEWEWKWKWKWGWGWGIVCSRLFCCELAGRQSIKSDHWSAAENGKGEMQSNAMQSNAMQNAMEMEMEIDIEMECMRMRMKMKSNEKLAWQPHVLITNSNLPTTIKLDAIRLLLFRPNKIKKKKNILIIIIKINL